MGAYLSTNGVERISALRGLLGLDSGLGPVELIELSDSNAPDATLHALASRDVAVDELADRGPKPFLPYARDDAMSSQIGTVPSRMVVAGQDCMPESMSAAFLRVLLAEDNPVVKRYTALLLGKLGCRTDFAGNGIEVVEAVGRQSYDVVLMDVQMPELDGLDATRQIRSLTGSATAPWVIAMTANASSADCEACATAGMNDFLAKPVGLQELEAALRLAGRALAKENGVPLPFVQPETQPSHDRREGRRINLPLLAAAYMEDARQSIAQLISLAEVNDFLNLQRKAHYLKGSSLVVGAVDVSRICSKIEKQAAAQESVLLLLEELCNSLGPKSFGIVRIPELVG